MINAVRKEEEVERRRNLDSETGARLKCLLIAGPRADALAAAFARLLPLVRVEAALRQDQALLAISAGHFDAVLIDCRANPHFGLLAVMAARQFPSGRAVMLAAADFQMDYGQGLANLAVLSSANSTSEVLEALNLAARQPVPESVTEPASEVSTDDSAALPSGSGAVERTSAAASWLANLLPRLTPVYSLIYRNLALVILGALFTAFLAFGVMIVFFLVSNKWAAPITLSPGHELVTRVERDLEELNVRKNQIMEQLGDARKNVAASEDELTRARQQAAMIEGTITAEIETRRALRAEISEHNEALRGIAVQYGSGMLNPEFKGNLSRDFNNRLINRNTFDAGKLAQLESAHRTALIRNEIAANDVEIRRLSATLTALTGLSGSVESSKAPAVAQGGADLVPLLNQVIDVRKSLSVAASENANALKRSGLLANSLGLVESAISQIAKTPLARAARENITVLFVPYENAGQFGEGGTLYTCAIGIFFCSEAGMVGKAIPGETVATHPFFNKPVRGSFVEANLSNPDAAKKEIIHVKRRPLFF